MLYSRDFRHLDMIQYLGLYGVDLDGTDIYHLSTPQFNLWSEFKHISKGFDPKLLTHYHTNQLKKAAGDDPCFIIYYAPGPLPTPDLADLYRKQEMVFQCKLTTYSHWSWLVIALNKSGAETIDNKKYKALTMNQFYRWMAQLYKVPVDESLELDKKHSVQFKMFFQDVEDYFSLK